MINKTSYSLLALFSLSLVLIGCGDGSESESMKAAATVGSKVANPAQASGTEETKKEPVEPTPPTDKEWKRSGPFSFPVIEHDFGDIRDTEKVSYDFHFVNAEPHVVRILEIKKVCGCTIPEMAKKEYQPGEKGILTVAFDGNHRQGQDRKPITVVTDNIDSPNVQVTIKAFVIARIAIEPRAMFLGQFRPGVEAPVKQIKIISRNLDLAIEDVQLADKRFTFESKGSERTTDHGDNVIIHTFDLGFTGDHAIDQIRAMMKIKTNDAEMKHINVAVLAHVVGPIHIVPFQVNIRGQKPNEEFSHSIQLGPRERDFQFKVLSYELVNPQEELGLKLEMLPIDERRKGWVTLELKGRTPESTPQNGGFKASGSVLIRTDIAEQPEVIIPIQGTLMYR